MRILMILFNQVAKGGTYWRALYLAQSLVKSGHQVTVLATSPQRHWGCHHFWEGEVMVVETPDLCGGSLRSGWDPWNVLNRIIWLRGQSFDLVHAFEGRPVASLPARYLQQRHGVKLVMDWCDWFGQGGSVEQRTNPFIRTVLRPIETFFETKTRPWAEGTTAINPFLRQRAINLGIAPETILLLPNGSNTKVFFPQSQTEMRQRLGISLETLLIGYVGAIFTRDAALMAQAFNQLQVLEPRAQLLLVGFTNPLFERMLASPGQVTRLGAVSPHVVNDWLAACDVCWLPLCDSGANRGRTPLKLNDYLALGRPIVATAVGDLVEFFEQYPAGWLAEPNPDDLARQTLAALSDPVSRIERGQCARWVAEQVLNWDLLAVRLEHFYKQVLNKR